MGRGVVELALVLEHACQVAMDLGEFGPQGQNLAIGGGRFGQSARGMFALGQRRKGLNLGGRAGGGASRRHRVLFLILNLPQQSSIDCHAVGGN